MAMMSNADFFLAGLDTGEDAQDRDEIERVYLADPIEINYEVESVTRHEVTVTFRDGITRRYEVSVTTGGDARGTHVEAREKDCLPWKAGYSLRCSIVENLVRQHGPQESFKVI